jgi:hypothetical protein
MGGWNLRFTKRKSFLGGLFTLNLNKKSVSVTTKIGPVSHTRSTNGRHTTSVSGPGPASVRKISTPASRAAGRHRGRSETPPDHRGRSEEERQRDAQREALRARMAARRENIRRMREERRESTRRWREERDQHE